MDRLFLAVRYVWSRPLSWVSVLGIWLSVTALLVVVGIWTGFLREMRSVIRGTTSDLVLTPWSIPDSAGRFLPPPPFPLIADTARGIDEVVGICPHLLRPGLLCGGELDASGKLVIRVEEASPVQIVGLDPAREAGVTEFLDYVRRIGDDGVRVDDPPRPFATPLGAPADLPVVLVGEGLAKERELTKGDVVALVAVPEDGPGGTEGPGGAPRVLSGRFVVGGLVRTGHYQNDQTQVFLDLEVARAFAELPGASTEVCVLARDGVELEAFGERLQTHFRESNVPVFVETWKERHGRYMSSIENQRSILGYLLFFFVAVACFNVFATLTLLVSDKTRDIGVLNAMGASTAGISSIFVTCAVLITGVGAALGTITGLLLANHMDAVNDGVEALFGVRIFRPDIYVFQEIPVDIEPWFVVLVLTATLALAVVSALIPSVRAARLDPVSALRYE